MRDWGSVGETSHRFRREDHSPSPDACSLCARCSPSMTNLWLVDLHSSHPPQRSVLLLMFSTCEREHRSRGFETAARAALRQMLLYSLQTWLTADVLSGRHPPNEGRFASSHMYPDSNDQIPAGGSVVSSGGSLRKARPALN